MTSLFSVDSIAGLPSKHDHWSTMEECLLSTPTGKVFAEKRRFVPTSGGHFHTLSTVEAASRNVGACMKSARMASRIDAVKKPPKLDKFACDPDAWYASARFTHTASQTLFNAGNVIVVFAAATLGHHALEMYLKTALICEGMTACKPSDAPAFGITKTDCAWGHDLFELARLPQSLRPEFRLTSVIDVYGYFPHKMPMTIEGGFRLFQPFFDELRYPHEKELMEGIGQYEVIVLDALVLAIKPFICVWS